MESTLHLPKPETASVWTDEKHLHFLNTMEASFVNTMLHHYGVVSSHPLRLDRYLPDTSESTLDSKPNSRPTKHARSASDSMGPRGRRTKRRSSQLHNSSAEQAAAQVENGRDGAASVAGGGGGGGGGGDDKDSTSNSCQQRN